MNTFKFRKRASVTIATILCLFVLRIYVLSVGVDESGKVQCDNYPFNAQVFHECQFFPEKLLNDIMRVNDKPWRSKDTETLLTMFTTFDTKMEKKEVYLNTLRNWKLLGKNVNVVVYSDSASTSDLATSANIQVLPVKQKACGAPVLKSLFINSISTFKSELYGYANADILFNGGFIKTLSEILKSDHFNKGPLLIVGRRSEFNITSLRTPVINTIEEVEHLGMRSTLSHGMAGDVFITNNLFLWDHMPDHAVGRATVDNWLVWFARATGAKVIDITFSTLSLHQKTDFKKLSGWPWICNAFASKDLPYSPYLPIWRGSIDCAGFLTQMTLDSKIRIIKKTTLFPHCYY